LPANNSLIVDDGHFLRMVGVLDPQPCLNGLDGVAGLIEQLSKELAL
jgi:hypothetical protein